MEKEKILGLVRNIAILFSVLFIVSGLSNFLGGSVYKNVERCEIGNIDFDCYLMYYESLVEKKGSKKAFDSLKEDFDKNPYVKSQCHQLAHVIGRVSLTVYKTVADAFEKGDDFCSSGYYHGVMEEMAKTLGVSKISSEINTICDTVSENRRYSLAHHNCTHGLGHGLMGITEGEVFSSIELCDALDDSWEQSSCHGGVFMENIMADSSSHPSKYLKKEDPLYPCSAVEDRYKSPCYLIQTAHILKVVDGDFKKVFDVCANAGKDFRGTCYQSLGRDASGWNLGKIEPVKRICDMGVNFEQRSNCIIGSVKDLVWYHYSDKEAKKLCDIISPDLKQLCLDTAVSYYETF